MNQYTELFDETFNGVKGHAAGGAGPDTDGLVTEHAACFLPSGRETLLRAADPEKDDRRAASGIDRFPGGRR